MVILGEGTAIGIGQWVGDRFTGIAEQSSHGFTTALVYDFQRIGVYADGGEGDETRSRGAHTVC